MFEEQPELYEVQGDIEVHPLNYRLDQKRPYTVVVSATGQGWLMPTEDVPGNFPFRMLLSEVAKLPVPYDFTKIIEELMPTVESIKIALWFWGIVTKDDLRNVTEIRNALGHLPSANSFVKYAVGDNCYG